MVSTSDKRPVTPMDWMLKFAIIRCGTPGTKWVGVNNLSPLSWPTGTKRPAASARWIDIVAVTRDEARNGSMFWVKESDAPVVGAS